MKIMVEGICKFIPLGFQENNNYFRPATDTVPMDINCKPILKKDQMEKYERYAKLKAKKLQLKRMKVKKVIFECLYQTLQWETYI